MVTDERKVFFKALRQILGPQLRADGFGGSGANYRRFREPVIQVINIQGSRYGGQFCVNLGIHLTILPTLVGPEPDPKTMREPQCEFRRRLAPAGKMDHWWSYGADEAGAAANAERLAEVYRDCGRPYLDQWFSFPGRFAQVTVEDLEQHPLGALPGAATTVRAALAFARIHEHLNQQQLAREFAALGLKHLGQATALRADLECLLDGPKTAG